MSELAKLAGTGAPPHTIEHEGRTFIFRPALDNATLLALESSLYERDRTALSQARNDYPPDEYLKRLDAIVERRKRGAYSIGSPETEAFLKTTTGAVFLLRAMCDASEAEILSLLMHRSAEIERILRDTFDATFPESNGPKVKAHRRKVR
jgi:hypothetical protein